ncbi:MAG: copper homeostasis membrane protein CopD [Sphingomicrobium sp.]
MADWPLIAVRFALYADLGLAFGWPLFWLYALNRQERSDAGQSLLAIPLIFSGVAGLILSALGFGLMVAAMGGTGLWNMDPSLLSAVLHEAPVGMALQLRMAALAMVAAAGLLALRFPSAGLKVAAGGGAVALASLAWNGHAAATEGKLGAVHLASDFLHLWAAGLWIGALFALLSLVAGRSTDPVRMKVAHRALEKFSHIGTATVLVLIVTGIVNGTMILGFFDPRVLVGTPYGQLLLLKLALFALMLGLAAANRFRLTPGLAAVLTDNGSPGRAAARLRLSIGLETTAALAILALVGWLGTLEPGIAS